ncbi:MAG: hypothetical protein KME50_12370 [Nostoc desertorum CM1-VF14]|nr:hypothetical protein [Nostoc desertorum CM1-VF14]
MSDTLTGNSREEETAHAPLGVASPQIVVSVSENEVDLPVAMDCMTLMLVDAAQSNPASLLAENQDCGIDSRDCHEGTDSAASVAQNLTDLLELAQAQATLPTSLKTENSASGVEVKADHEGKSSAAPVPSAEKWSHEAIVARSDMRPQQECWDDPALQIAIKKLLAKFPQWGIAVVDGELVNIGRSSAIADFRSKHSEP